jgi:hypothetical protein
MPIQQFSATDVEISLISTKYRFLITNEPSDFIMYLVGQHN